MKLFSVVIGVFIIIQLTSCNDSISEAAVELPHLSVTSPLKQEAKITREECEAANLGYRDPNTLKPEDFTSKGRLWIPDGGQWLYARS